MSMRDYSFTTHGIVLNGLLDSDILDDLAEDDVVGVQFPFTGEALPLDDGGSTLWSSDESFSEEALYYVELPKSPHLFRAAYRDMDALVADMLDRYRSVCRRDYESRLPALTANQVRSRLRIVQGTYYG